MAQISRVQEFKLNGIVSDSKNAPVSFANVLLYKSSDSTASSGTTTSAEQ